MDECNIALFGSTVMGGVVFGVFPGDVDNLY